MAAKVVVRGANVFDPPLLTTDQAERIEFQDPADDSLMAVFYQIQNGMWMFTKRDDPDWADTLLQIGYTQEMVARSF